MMYKNGDRIPGKSHVYFFDGFHYPSATTIIHRVEPESPELTRWKQTYKSPVFKSAREYTEYTSIRGTFAHFSVLNSLSPFPIDAGDLPELSRWQRWQELLLQDVRKCRSLWDNLEIDVKPPMQIENALCHHGKKYAGQPDLAAPVTYDNETAYTLIDLKTSKQTYDSHLIQIGAYAQMINDYTKNKVERALLIYLNPSANTPRVREVDVDEIRENINIFNGYCDDFYSIPGVIDEYRLVVSR